MATGCPGQTTPKLKPSSGNDSPCFSKSPYTPKRSPSCHWTSRMFRTNQLTLRRRPLRHEPELRHDLHLVEVQARVGDGAILDPEDLHAASVQALVRGRDVAAGAAERALLRPLERELLRDPVAGDELVLHRD